MIKGIILLGFIVFSLIVFSIDTPGLRKDKK